MNNQNQTGNSSQLPKAAYFLVASGGGVVGHDYATWMEVDPVIGAGIGGIISMIIMKTLYQLYLDPGNKIKDKLTFIGAFIGMALGSTIVSANSGGSDTAWFVGLGIGGLIGAGLGQMAAAIVSLAAFALIFLSQGPVGLMVRTFITNSN